MADNNSPSRAEREARIEELDAQSPSPDARTQAVYEILKKHAPELTAWDLICFSANYLGLQFHAFPWLEGVVKHLCRLVYTAHYFSDNDNFTESGVNTRGDIPPQSGDTGANSKRERKEHSTGFNVTGGGFK